MCWSSLMHGWIVQRMVNRLFLTASPEILFMKRLAPIALLFCVPIFSAYAADAITLSSQQQRNLGVQTQVLATALTSAGGAQNGWPARVEVPANNQRMVTAPVAGLVTRLTKSAGDPVRAGESLASLASTELLAEQRGLMTTQAQLRLARDKAVRDEKLFAEGIIAESRLRQSQAELATAQAEYGAQRATLRAYGVGDQGVAAMSAGKLSTSLGVAAPISGVVLEQLADVGSRVEMGAPLYKLANLSRLILEIQLPASQANVFAPGQTVTVAGSQAVGKITAIGAQVGGAQTLTVRAEVRDPQNLLRPGQQVEARTSAQVKGNFYSVPAQAIAWQSGKAYVFVATPSGFNAMPVSVQTQSSQSVLVGGLKGNERIAVSGLAALKSLWQGGGE